MRTTDMADELFRGPETELPAGVRLATAKRGGVTVTRVEIAREGLARPRGRYVTLEVPSVSVLDERDAAVIEVCARELRALLPPEGPVLVLGIGNRRVTADALGPRTAQKILVTMGPQHTLPVKGIRPVAAIAPGVSASTGLTLRQLAGAMVEAVRPAALICVDSLCSAEGARLGRSVQFSDTGLYPAQADHAKHLNAAALGVPVIAAGIPTLMQAEEGRDLVVTPRDLDGVIAHGAALLGLQQLHAVGAGLLHALAVLEEQVVFLLVGAGEGHAQHQHRQAHMQARGSYWERQQSVRIDGAVLSYLFCRRG